MRRTLTLLSLASLASLALACGEGGGTPVGTTGGGGGGGGGGGTPVATTNVSLLGSAFVPPAIVVAPNATVTWTNNEGIAHNVTFANSAIGSIGNWTSGSRTSTMPATAGVYNYSCTLHAGMNGSVQVQ